MRTATLLSLIIGFIGITSSQTIYAEPVAKIRIGVSTPLTGDASTFGQDVRDILLFANKTIAGGAYELVFEDDKCSAKEGATVANRFVNVLKVPYVIGLPCSSSTLSAAPIYERGKVVTMVTWASSPKIARSGDYIFRVFPSDALAARILSRRMAKGAKRVALLSAQTDYAQDMKAAFLESAGFETLDIRTEDYIPKSPDLRSVILKLKAGNPEVLFLNTEDEAGFELALRAVRALNWNIRLFGAYWPSSASLLKNIPKEMEDVEFVDSRELSSVLTHEGKKLFSEFQAEYGGLRSSESTFAPTFEGFRALHLAIQSGRDVRAYLYDNQFDGIFGKFNFDKDGESPDLGFALKKIENGKVTLIVD